MDPAKAKFIFGAESPTIDLEDQEALSEHMWSTVPKDLPNPALAAILREVIANQILGDEPPLVWQTACRLLDAGLSRDGVFEELALAFVPTLMRALVEDDVPDPDAPDYESLLRQLPLPSPEALAQAYRDNLIRAEPMHIDDLESAVLDDLGVTTRSIATRQALDSVFTELLDDGEVALTVGDLVVVPTRICRGIVLTTRKTSPLDWPPLDTDLAGFTFLPEPIPQLPSTVSPGDLVMVRHDRGGITVEAAPETAPEDAFEVVRLAYEAVTAESGLPLSFAELVLHLLREEAEWFSTPRRPLSELVAAAGLEIRDDLMAADESVWRRAAYSHKILRIADLADDEEQRRAGFAVLRAFEAVNGNPALADVVVDTTYLRETLDLMSDPELLAIVTDQFLGDDDDPAAVGATETFARRLTAAASRPSQRAVAAWLTAVVSERRCDPLAAAQALAEAVRYSPDFFPAVDRLAWTRSDQGRAADATALWSEWDVPDNPDLMVVQAVSASPAAKGMRRNQPCWCGSGRKYKVCHLRVTDLPALPDRFGWMLRKTTAYLERRGAPIDNVVDRLVLQLADEDPDRLLTAMDDPMVMDLALDLALLEHGWFERFLAERGPLLPPDEQLLYSSWLLVPRTLYGVTDVRRDDGVTLRDLRTGDVTEVADHAFSREASAGQIICARALPDGRGHRLGPAVFSVPPGREQLLLRILDEPEGRSIADGIVEYFAAANRVSPLVTFERQELRRCELVLEVGDTQRAREFLNRSYETEATDRWHQTRAANGQDVIHAFCRLEGRTLTVQTLSEQRMQTISHELKAGLPDARTVSEVSEPSDLRVATPPPENSAHQTINLDTGEALTSWLEQQEMRWCGESVPALGGLTPQQAAADPTRREQVIRLVDSFGPDDGVTDDGVATMRPHRLRELLDLSME